VCSGKRKSAGGYHWKYVKSNWPLSFYML
jgi:hypothetical protein